MAAGHWISAGIILFFLIIGFIAEKNRDSGKGGKRGKAGRQHAKRITDQYESIPQVQAALRKAGLESSQLIVAVDCTGSNTTSGARSFGGRSLHSVDSGRLNPYQEVLSIIGRTLSGFDADGLIPLWGFGDTKTTNRAIFNFKKDGSPCKGLEEALDVYRQRIPQIGLSGPTSFAPAIRAAVKQCRESGEYTILLIVADGLVTDKVETERAIVEASNYPLSIIIVGVGDLEEWEEMERLDDELPARKFDNVQVVNWTKAQAIDPRYRDAAFAVQALQEIPDQYKEIQRLCLL